MPVSFLIAIFGAFLPLFGEVFLTFGATFFFTERVFLGATFFALAAVFFWILAFRACFLAAGLAALEIALVFFSGFLGLAADGLAGLAYFLAGETFALDTSATLDLARATILSNLSENFFAALISRFLDFS